MIVKKETGFLHGTQTIMDYLGVSKYVLKKLIADGLPVQSKNGMSVAHVNNLESFLIDYTRQVDGVVKQACQ